MKTSYLIHRNDTGVVVISGTNEEENIFCAEDCTLILGARVEPGKHYVRDGIVKPLPAKPSLWMVWNLASETWVDQRSVDEVRLEQKRAVKARRDRAIYAGISIAGLQIATDDVSQQRIMSVALSATMDPNYEVKWKISSDVFVTLSSQEILFIAQEVRNYIQACFDNESDLVDLINSGSSYDIDTGWP